MRTYNLIYAKLGPASRVAARPYRFALLVGACTGIASTVLALCAIGLMLAFLPHESLGESAAAGLSHLGPVMTLLTGVVLVPLWETLIAQLLPLELARRLGFNDCVCIALGAVVFASGHYLNGGLGHGIGSLVAGALFSTGYMAMRPWGYFPAFWASYIAHALNNCLFLYLVPLAFPD
ncbi:CPBP family intramembrane metalloprotease [Pseudoduganella sp. FT26W]|uniref:CPBP family intramembrane metalloprotease n=1 Tax=Duganella aquatilis TaxID=2666082 RepID=A0A844DCD4_9BURK|nr:CPBP family glutamic-type intramembrane protease [Duganella aquatilis]MRW85490.1 CPBP family intramembrane metalloprotease [Duganella aquatilis]